MLNVSSLEALPLLRGLKPAALEALATSAVERRLEPGQRLWHAGDEPRAVFFVLSGEVRILVETDGRTQVLHKETCGPLGDATLFAGTRYTTTAEAVCESRCAVVNRQTLAAAMAIDPELAFRFLGGLAQHCLGLVGIVDERTQHVRTRLARRLVERRAQATGKVLTLGVSQARLAEELGTVREVLVRELRALREAGILEAAGRGRFVILDEPALQARAR